jgi:hypothetical protein
MPTITSGSSDGKAGGGWRMGVANGVNIRAHAVKQKVHGQFRGGFAVPSEMATLEVNDDQVIGGEHPFVHARRSGEYPFLVEPHGKIALAGNDVFALVHPAPGNADVRAMLLFGLRGTG